MRVRGEPDGVERLQPAGADTEEEVREANRSYLIGYILIISIL